MTMQSEINVEKQLRLEKVLQDKNLYRIFFEDGSSYLCTEDDMFEYKLYKNSLINQDILELLEKKTQYYNCLNEAIRIVNVKQYSIKQVRDKLLNKNFDVSDIDKVIEYLEKLNVLNDTLFYEAYVEFKINQGYGPIYIKNKLFELGINESVKIDYDKQYELIEKEFNNRNKGKDTKSIFINKFRTRMLNQGFSLEIVDEVLDNNVIKEDNSKLKKEINKLLIKYSSEDEYQTKQKIKQRLIAKGYKLNEIDELLKEEY